MLVKNYSLLRPFDLEAAKRGDAICWEDGDVLLDVTVTGRGSVCGRWDGDDRERLWQDDELDSFRMAPLCWVKGKPVYKGDVLWYSYANFSITVTGLNPFYPDDGLKGIVRQIIVPDPDYPPVGEETWAPFDVWSWAPPRIEREGFTCMTRLSKDMVTPHGAIANVIVRNGLVFDTYGAAKAWADTCKDVVYITRMAWEEPLLCEEEDDISSYK